MISERQARKLWPEQHKRRHEQERSFLDALRKADGSRLLEAMDYMEWTPRFLRSLAKLPKVSNESRALVLSIWIRSGDHWRSEVNDDLLLLDVLRNLLPPYKRDAVRLFRGESAFNRRHRTYGFAWTSDRIVAESFAKNNAERCSGGTALLETFAPRDAIICVPQDHNKEFHAGEAEYIVDRRRLDEVRVIKRCPEAEVRSST